MSPTENIVIAAGQVRLCPDARHIPLPSSGGFAGPAAPTVDLIRDGETLLGVEITCSCGQRIRLRFDTA